MTCRTIGINSFSPFVGGLSISSSYDHVVSETCDINGRLPNRIFTLSPGTLAAIINHITHSIGTKETFPSICRKFFRVANELQERQEQVSCGTRDLSASLYLGRLYSHSLSHASLTWVRLPPAVQVWPTTEGCVIETTSGLYTWSPTRPES